MIKSIKLANSYPAIKVGFIGKNISSLYNTEFNINFSIVILNDFFEEFVKSNSIENKINSLIQTLTKNSTINDIEEISSKIIFAISNSEFSDDLKEQIDDAYETLPWESSSSAGDLLSNPKHKVNIIASPDYVTAPIIFPGVNKESISEQIKEIYKHFFSKEEILYRINSDVDEKFSIGIILQRQENFSASAFAYKKKNEDLIKVYVFPGMINPKDLMSPDEEVKPDQYEIFKDSLKLKSSNAGKQSFKNIEDNGKFKRVECQINNFILNDAAAIEIARLTKKASTILEKNVQIIFEIKKDAASIMHISNLIDLQDDYHKKINNIIHSSEETNNNEDMNELPALDEIEEEHEPDAIEPIEEKKNYENDQNFDSEFKGLEENYEKIKQTNVELESAEKEILSENLVKIPEEETQKESIETDDNEEPSDFEQIKENPIIEEKKPEQIFEKTEDFTEPLSEENEESNILDSNEHDNENNNFNHSNSENNSLDLNSNKPLNELMEEEVKQTNIPNESNEEEQKTEPVEYENNITEQNNDFTQEPQLNEEVKETVEDSQDENASFTDSEPTNILDEPEKKEENTINFEEEVQVEDILSEKKDEKKEEHEQSEDDFIM